MLMRALSVHIAHETAGAARTRHSLRPLYFRGGEVSRKPRALRAARSQTRIHLSSPAKAGDPVFQRHHDRTEKPRRTGSPAFAEDDSFGFGRTDRVIPGRASWRGPGIHTPDRGCGFSDVQLHIKARAPRAP